MIAIGNRAPDFTLKDQDDREITLSNIKDKKILLSFRPLAWTPVCRDQMKSLEENYAQLEKLNTIPFGIGVDSSPSNMAWALTMGIKKLRLLSDFWPHGKVAKAYSVFLERYGFAERANIIIDENQRIIFKKVYDTGSVPDINEIIDVLNKEQEPVNF